MKWFKHDSDASSDAKVKKLIIRHGAVGHAVYFHCLELITADLSESKLTFELEHDAEIIADNLKINGNGNEAGVDIVNKIMNTIIELDLFRSSSDRIFCIKLAKRLDTSMTSNQRFRDLIKKSHDRVMIESGIRHDRVMQEENRLKENRHNKNIIKESAKSSRFLPPTVEEVQEYCRERINNVNQDTFIDFYTAKGWMIGKTKMKDWKAAVRTWEKNNYSDSSKPHLKTTKQIIEEMKASGEIL